MSKKDFKGVTVVLPKDESRVRVSGHFIEMFTSLRNWKYGYIQNIKDNKMSIDDVILETTGIKEDEDIEMYSIYRKVLEYQLGNFRMKNMNESVTLKSAIDITRLFDSDEKVNTFLYFLMKHCIENDVNGIPPMVEIENSFCIDYSYLLQVLEEMMVEIYGANREDSRRYLRREFLKYDSSFFLIFGIFSLNHHLLSMMISDYTYTIKSKDGTRKEIKKSWSPAFYVDENGKEFYFRQVQFSKPMLQNRLGILEKSGKDTLLNFSLYAKFLDRLNRHKLTQTHWGKEATKRYRELGNEVKNFWKYNEPLKQPRTRA